jgi:cytochrome P450
MQLVQQARYGEMTTLHMGTKTWVLLNSSRVVNEIIAKRAKKTHERPFFPIAGELVSRNKRLFLQRTDDWREGRRLLHQLLMGPGSNDHGGIVEQASLELLQAYSKDPKAWYAHNYRYAVNVMHQILTNTPLQKSRAELDDLQQVTSTFLTAINSSAVEFFPQLSRLPKTLQFWRSHWERIGRFHHSVFKHWWTRMHSPDETVSEGSFVRDTVRKVYSGSDEQAMYTTMLAISAGADNPRMTMNAWVMACLAYPEKMERAREEIVSVCGQAARLPVLKDIARMPYVCAVVKEVLRWRPTVPLVPQRVLVEDIEFEGYKFPAGTEFLINTIAVCSRDHESPERFLPERWLIGKNEGSGVAQDLWQFAFSAGMRSCIGYRLAQKELFIAFSRLLYCFEFLPAGAYDDKDLRAFDLGEPFPVEIRVRSQAHAGLFVP